MTNAYVRVSFDAYVGTLEVYGSDLLRDDFDAAMTAAKLAANGWAKGPKFGSQSMFIMPSNLPVPVPSARELAAIDATLTLRTRSAERAARAVLQGRGYTVTTRPK